MPTTLIVGHGSGQGVENGAICFCSPLGPQIADKTSCHCVAAERTAFPPPNGASLDGSSAPMVSQERDFNEPPHRAPRLRLSSQQPQKQQIGQIQQEAALAARTARIALAAGRPGGQHPPGPGVDHRRRRHLFAANHLQRRSGHQRRHARLRRHRRARCRQQPAHRRVRRREQRHQRQAAHRHLSRQRPRRDVGFIRQRRLQRDHERQSGLRRGRGIRPRRRDRQLRR